MMQSSTGKACCRSGCRTTTDSFPTRCSRSMMSDRGREGAAPHHEHASLQQRYTDAGPPLGRRFYDEITGVFRRIIELPLRYKKTPEPWGQIYRRKLQ